MVVMRLRALVLVCWLLALAGARAQAIEVAVPPDRFAAPGEFVTLVFRITSPVPLEVEIAADTGRDWPVP